MTVNLLSRCGLHVDGDQRRAEDLLREFFNCPKVNNARNALALLDPGRAPPARTPLTAGGAYLGGPGLARPACRLMPPNLGWEVVPVTPAAELVADYLRLPARALSGDPVTAVLVAAVAVMLILGALGRVHELRDRRAAAAIAVQGEIADALLPEPRAARPVADADGTCRGMVGLACHREGGRRGAVPRASHGGATHGGARRGGVAREGSDQVTHPRREVQDAQGRLNPGLHVRRSRRDAHPLHRHRGEE